VKRKKAKSLDVCDAFDTPSPSKLSRIASAGGLHMYLTHNVIFLSYSINGGWTIVNDFLRRRRARIYLSY
jgi:hypothetical protein